MSKRVELPKQSRLTSIALSRGVLHVTAFEGQMAGRMYTLRCRVDPDDAMVLHDLRLAGLLLAEYCLDRLAALRGEGDDELDLSPTEGL